MSATIVEATSEIMKDTPRGMSILPSIPFRKKKRKEAGYYYQEELSIGILTSLEASNTIVIAGRRKLGGRLRFIRSRRYTFSTSTIASSTSEPMAIAMPPRVMVLMVRLKRCRISNVIITDMGRATAEISVVRKFTREYEKHLQSRRLLPQNKAMTEIRYRVPNEI